MMLSFIGMMVTYFFTHRLMKLAVLGSLWLGFVLVFIGMIVGSKYVILLYIIYKYADGYDTIASTWWIEVGLSIIGFLNFLEAFSE